jgi:plastocyanin
VLLAATGLLAAAASLCGAARAEIIRVEVKRAAFVPPEVTANLGDTIEWVNDDFVAHTATARSGARDVRLPPHAAGQIVVKEPGNAEYYCRYHLNMMGKVRIAHREG